MFKLLWLAQFYYLLVCWKHFNKLTIYVQLFKIYSYIVVQNVV